MKRRRKRRDSARRRAGRAGLRHWGSNAERYEEARWMWLGSAARVRSVLPLRTPGTAWPVAICIILRVSTRDAQSSNEDQIPVQSDRRAGVMPFHLLESSFEHFHTLRSVEPGITQNDHLTIRAAVPDDALPGAYRTAQIACLAPLPTFPVMESQDNRVQGESHSKVSSGFDHVPIIVHHHVGLHEWDRRRQQGAIRPQLAGVRGAPGQDPNAAGRCQSRHWEIVGDLYGLRARTKALTRRPPAASKRP